MASGALAALSGAKTGRSPKDKRVVRDASVERDIWWAPRAGEPANGSPNFEMDEHTFLLNRERAVDYLNMLDRIFVFDGYAGWDPGARVKVRVVCGRAYHALFMHNMLIRPTEDELAHFGEPDFTIFNAGAFPVNRYTSFMSSSTSIDVHLGAGEMVILGTQYAGEMKKGVFSVMHYHMPKRGVLSLHSGCNVGAAGDVTLFFGLSGTGKTTLSTDPARPLVGDDEHCWSDTGVFNIEGGCGARGGRGWRVEVERGARARRPTPPPLLVAAATPSASASKPPKSPRSTPPSALAPCWRTSSSTSTRAPSRSTPTR